MKFSNAYEAGVGFDEHFGLGADIRFLVYLEIVPFSVSKRGANDLAVFPVHHYLRF